MRFLRDLDWGNWLYGLWVAVVGGGANAVVGGVALNLKDPSHFNAQNQDFYEVVFTLWGASATLSFFLYLKQKPAPDHIVTKEIKTTVETVEKLETSNPEVRPDKLR